MVRYGSGTGHYNINKQVMSVAALSPKTEHQVILERFATTKQSSANGDEDSNCSNYDINSAKL